MYPNIYTPPPTCMDTQYTSHIYCTRGHTHTSTTLTHIHTHISLHMHSHMLSLSLSHTHTPHTAPPCSQSWHEAGAQSDLAWHWWNIKSGEIVVGDPFFQVIFPIFWHQLLRNLLCAGRALTSRFSELEKDHFSFLQLHLHWSHWWIFSQTMTL